MHECAHPPHRCRPPQHEPPCIEAGLRARERVTPVESPSRAAAQWLPDSTSLTYRCGGSAGFSLSRDHRLPVSLGVLNDPRAPQRGVSLNELRRRGQSGADASRFLSEGAEARRLASQARHHSIQCPPPFPDRITTGRGRPMTCRASVRRVAAAGIALLIFVHEGAFGDASIVVVGVPAVGRMPAGHGRSGRLAAAV